MSKVIVLACAALMAASAASATTVTLSASDNGWYRDDGHHSSQNQNIIAGTSGSYNYRNFQLFDITGLSGTVTSATLTFFAANGQYFGDASETIDVREVTTDGSIVDDTHNVNSAAGLAIYADLADGASFGTQTVSASYGGAMPEVSVMLNLAGISALSSAIDGGDNYFTFGTSLITDDGNDQLWSSSNSSVASSSLTITTAEVPVPAAGGLLLLGLGAFGVARRRRGYSASSFG